MNEPQSVETAPSPSSPPAPNETGGATGQSGGDAGFAEAPGLVARGLCMGMADVVPGVSGGTVALILGVYARLIEAIRSVDPRRLQAIHWRFLAFLGTGVVAGFVVCVKVIGLPHLLETHPEPCNGLFFGLIVGSVVLLGRDLRRLPGAGPHLWGPGLVGAVVCLGVGLLSGQRALELGPLGMIAMGAIAISAMILPGISGSFLLLVLGQYAVVLGAAGDVLDFDSRSGPALLQVVLPFGLGCLLGLALFSRLLSWLLRRFRPATLAFMTGLLVGSLYILWPFQDRITGVIRHKTRYLGTRGPRLPDAWDLEALLALALIPVGVAVVLGLERLASGLSDHAGAQLPERKETQG